MANEPGTEPTKVTGQVLQRLRKLAERDINSGPLDGFRGVVINPHLALELVEALERAGAVLPQQVDLENVDAGALYRAAEKAHTESWGTDFMWKSNESYRESAQEQFRESMKDGLLSAHEYLSELPAPPPGLLDLELIQEIAEELESHHIDHEGLGISYAEAAALAVIRYAEGRK